MCWTAFPAVLWIICKERNSQCFEDSISSAEDLAYRLKFTIALWTLILTQFQGILIDLILRNWKEVALPFKG